MTRSVLSTALAALTLASAGALHAQTNTLLLVGDDMGIDTMSIYGLAQSPPPTPNLNALAKNGVFFRNAFAAPACSPTRAMIHTGRYGFRTGVERAGQTLPFSEVTLPELLATKNFATGLIGKWHLGGNRAAENHPIQTGWQFFSGTIHNIDDYFSWAKVANGRTTTSTTYATTDNVNDALSWIGSQTKPWVLSVNFNAPHSPFHAPPSSLHTYNLTGNPRQNAIPHFKASIQALDAEIGRLISGLGSAASRTNIIFVGDNGTSGRLLEAPFIQGRGKFTVYEAGVQVPLIVSGPAVVQPDRSVSALVHVTDLFHTILELSGIDARSAVPANVELDGVSIVPYLKSASQAPLREYVFSQITESQNARNAIRDARYKIVRNSASTEEFYDLQNDPWEQRDLLTGTLNSEQQFARDRLAAEYDRIRGNASWFRFGAACAGSAGNPTLSSTSTPRLGSTFTAQVAPLGSSPAALGMLGFSNTEFGVIPLPLDLTGLGMNGCSLYVSIDVSQPLLNTSGSATWQLPIPNQTDLLGLHLYQQCLVLDASANSFGAVFSNAAQGILERN